MLLFGDSQELLTVTQKKLLNKRSISNWLEETEQLSDNNSNEMKSDLKISSIKIVTEIEYNSWLNHPIN